MSDVEFKDVHTHWMHARHEFENPIIKVNVGALAETWVAEVKPEYESAKVTVKKVLYEDNDGEIQSRVERVLTNEKIPE